MMDILVVKNVPSSNNLASSSISSIYNNFGRDAFFLKARMISDTQVGTTVPSASYRCVLTSLEDEKFMVSGG